MMLFKQKAILLLITLCTFTACKQEQSKAHQNLNEANSFERPNIVLIMTDQHQAQALSIAGNMDLSTPNIDKLAKRGVRFENAYATFPLCTPSRSSMFTGKMPHSIGVNSNKEGDNSMSHSDKQNSLGRLLKAAGYDCVYGGKWHAPEAEMVRGNGFESIADFGDMPLAEKCIDYLKTRTNNAQPFFMVASFDNPHSICEWARNEPLPYGNIAAVPIEETPQLPVNFLQSESFPEALKIEQEANKKVYPTKNYSEEDWRQYRYTYYRLVEKVDAEIGKIIDAIDDLGLRENTVIIFTSDHGDGNAAHGWNQKTALIQESINVPFIISDLAIADNGNTNNSDLISNGLDMYTTISDYANVESPENLRGKSLKPLLEGQQKFLDREFVVVETKFEGKQAFGTTGRALIGKTYKYVLYNWGKHREQLFDLKNDPLEMNNLINSKTHLKILDRSRQRLLEWCKQTDDNKFLRKLILPSKSKISSTELFDKPY